jgi:hypothetical protein
VEGSTLKLANVSFEAGIVTGGKVAFLIAGQKGKAKLGAPAAPLAGSER